MSTTSRHPHTAEAVRARQAGNADLFAALGHETRLRLVTLLCAGGALSISQLTAGHDISRQAVTKHLRVLADAGLVRDERAGRETMWSLEPARLELARRELDRIGAQWDRALVRLAQHLGE
jgi:DNA-binding transcriptional ArsR family regulator